MSENQTRSVRRFKLLSAALAVLLVVQFVRNRDAGDGDGTPADDHRPAVTAVPITKARAMRQLRASAASYGLNEDRLIAELRNAKTASRITVLAERLGFVGTDNAVDALTELAADRRTGVPRAVFKAIGQIGTDSAIRFLLAFETDGVPRHRGEAISAMGATGSEQVRARLTEIAMDRSDSERSTAIASLAELGGQKTVETFAAIIDEGADFYTARTIVSSLTDIDQADAQGLLLELATSGDLRVRAWAIDYMEFSASSETREILLAALESPDAEIAGTAAKTLARQGVVTALPRITKMALSGPRDAQVAAIDALSILGADNAHDVLGEIMMTSTGNVQSYAAAALAELGDDQAIDLLVAASMDESSAKAAIYALRDLRGPRVEDAMLRVAVSGRVDDRTSARQYLLDVGHPKGLELTIDLAMNGSGYTRTSAISALADHGSERAQDALREIAMNATGDAKIEAMSALAAAGTPDAGDMLRASLMSGDQREMDQAAKYLVKLGDDKSRDALLEALRSGHPATATAAANVILELDSGAETREALLTAAKINPKVRNHVVEKLIEKGAPEGIDLAREALADPASVSEASWAVARYGNADAQRLLAESARSPDATIRSEIAGALGVSESPSATGTLRDLASDDNEDVRKAALRSLGGLNSEAALDVIGEHLDSEDATTRTAAIEALGYSDTDRARQSLADVIETGDDVSAMTAIETRTTGSTIGKAMIRVIEDSSRSEVVRKAAAEQLRSLGMRLTDSQVHEVERLLEE